MTRFRHLLTAGTIGLAAAAIPGGSFASDDIVTFDFKAIERSVADLACAMDKNNCRRSCAGLEVIKRMECKSQMAILEETIAAGVAMAILSTLAATHAEHASNAELLVNAYNCNKDIKACRRHCTTLKGNDQTKCDAALHKAEQDKEREQ